jgi:hypothetical protein
MLQYRNKSQDIVDLSMVEQEIFAGGKSNFPAFNNMPNVLGNGFPNVSGYNPFGSTETGNTNEKIQAYDNNVGIVLF